MNMQIRRIVPLLIGLGLGACALDDEVEDLALDSNGSLELPESETPGATSASDLEASGGPAAVPTSLPIGLDPSCVDARMPIIAQVDHETVPDCEFEDFPADWTAQKLFVEASPWIQATTTLEPLPAQSPLWNYCKYDYVGSTAVEEAYANFIDVAVDDPAFDGGTFACDSPSVYPQAGLNVAETLGAAHETFMDSVRPVNVNLNDAPNLYLLDTKAEGLPASNPHAELLEALFTDVACGGNQAACQSRIHEVLVTPRSLDDAYGVPDWGAGGDKGCLHETAIAIAGSVLDCRRRNQDGDPHTHEQCIINLSVGAPKSGSYATALDRAPALAAIDAARMAACNGVEIYAAAGNGDPTDEACAGTGTGLMLPAIFETITRPSAAECLAWGYAPLQNVNHFPISYDEDGLVTAVAGVDHHGEALANTRLDGRPSHQASAFYAVSETGLDVRTGSSYAAMVYSAAAFSVWTVDPILSASELTSQIYQTSRALQDKANAGRFFGQRIRQVSICHAVAASVPGLLCPNLPGSDEDFQDATLDAVGTAELAGDLESHVHGTPALGPACGQPADLDFLEPQPPKPACQTCSVGKGSGPVGQDALYMTTTLLNAPIGAEVIEAYLHIRKSTGAVITLDLDATVVGDINAGDSAQVIEVLFDEPDTDSAVLEFVYEDDNFRVSSESNPLWVWTLAV